MTRAGSGAGAGLTTRGLLVGLALGVLGSVLFAGKAIIVKVAYRYSVSPEALLGLRMAFAAPLFAIVAWQVSRRRPAGAGVSEGVGADVEASAGAGVGAGVRVPAAASAFRAGDAWRIVGLGLVGYYFASLLDFLGLQYVSAGLERLVLYLNPAFVLLIGLFWFRRPIVRWQWLAMAVSYFGVVLVFLSDLQFSGDHLVLGTMLVLASGIAYAVYLIGSGEMVRRLGSLRLTAWASLVSSAACVAHALVVDGMGLFELQWQVYALSLLNAVFCTFFPLFLVMMAIERLGSGLASQTGMIGPAATIVLGAMFLDEPVTVLQLGGTAVVIAGVLMLTRAGRAAGNAASRPVVEPAAGQSAGPAAIDDAAAPGSRNR